MEEESIENKNELERIRWDGQVSSPVGKTPFGFFDSDSEFVSFAPRAADWAARRLGYPIVDIEMIDMQFYACLEEAVSEYSAQINQFSIKQNLYSLKGTSTSVNLTTSILQTQPLPFYLKLSEAYGAEVGVGGNVDWRKASLDVKAGVQTYDLQGLFNQYYIDAKTGEKKLERIEVKRIWHNPPPALNRIYDPMSNSGMSHSNLLNDFNWGGMSPIGTQFLLRPVNEDLMRLQAIEFNEMVRKSAYGFEIINNKLTILPTPTKDFKLWFDYVYKRERDIAAVQGYVDADEFNTMPKTQTQVTEETTQQVVSVENSNGLNDGTPKNTSSTDVNNNESPTLSDGSTNSVTDVSNVPYQFHSFSTINDVGKRWIMKYYLSVCKELLGAIRSKYQSIPIPGGETSLDGDALRSEAQQEKEQLVTELREDLEVTSRSTTSEQLNQVSDNLQENLKKVPNFMYIG
tara:strand:+ start:200 stop:1576 length:1377 start_codon:yes stop_codon:yes gene_type:complete